MCASTDSVPVTLKLNFKLTVTNFVIIKTNFMQSKTFDPRSHEFVKTDLH